MRKYLSVLLLAISLQGCTALPSTFAPESSRSELAQAQTDIQSIFVASSRAREADGTYGIERSADISFTNYQVTIPKNRIIGSILERFLASSAEFANTEITEMNSISSFSNAVVSHAQATEQSSEVMVFVHGFRSNFNHSLSRIAQIDLDFDFPAASVLYAWPAANSLVSYIHDLDSATFARDGLVDLLSGLASSRVSRIVIVGHSMGARLAMEAVRDMRLTGNQRFFNKLGGIALLSPDIDIDLFTSELRALEGMSAPVVAYVSTDDSTLRDFSNFFIEGKPRLGSITNIALLDGQSAVVIDVTNVGDTVQADHLAVATSPVMIAAINAMDRPDLITYANAVINGAVPGSHVSRVGDTIGVQLAPY